MVNPRWNATARLTALLAVTFVLAGCLSTGGTKPSPTGRQLDVLRLDYAYYSPTSLVLRRLGWLERELAAQGTRVEWVLSLGSNKANEHLASGTVHFASTAGSAALLARANGVPLKTVWVYAQPEWTALVATAGSGLRQVQDLRGKRVAVTRGTDPYFFLLQALDAAGLSERDVQIVHLQHPDGKAALLAGQVDAWAGLDPHMADAELNAGAVLFFRNRDWNTYGFLNVLEDFAAAHPDLVERVLAAYERARQWALDHPEETARILAEESGLALPVARKVLAERVAYPDPRPGAAQRAALARVAPLLRKEGLVPADADLDAVIEALLDATHAGRALGRAQGGSP